MPNKQSSNQSIKRAFSILNVVAQSNGGISVTEIAARTNLHKSTVSRMLATLQEVDAVYRISHWDGYRIGNGLLAMVSQVEFPQQLITITEPYLQALAQETGETVNLALPDGDVVHYIYQINSRYNLQIRDWTTDRVPLHGSVDGKIFLAYCSTEEVEAYLAQPLEAFSATTLTDPGELQANLAEIRKSGLAWTNGEYEAGLVAVAAPIRNHERTVVASFCIGGPHFRFPPEGKREEIVRLVFDAQAKIEAALDQLNNDS